MDGFSKLLFYVFDFGFTTPHQFYRCVSEAKSGFDHSTNGADGPLPQPPPLATAPALVQRSIAESGYPTILLLPPSFICITVPIPLFRRWLTAAMVAFVP